MLYAIQIFKDSNATVALNYEDLQEVKKSMYVLLCNK